MELYLKHATSVLSLLYDVAYDRIRKGEISGLDANELNFIILLGQREENIQVGQWTGLTESQKPLIAEELRAPTAVEDITLLRELTAEEQDVLRQAEDDSKRKSTTKQTELRIQRFKTFLTEQGLPTDIEGMPIRCLCSYLRLFFIQLKSIDASNEASQDEADNSALDEIAGERLQETFESDDDAYENESNVKAKMLRRAADGKK